MCDEAVDDCLAALKRIPDWSVTSQIFEKFDDVLLVNGNILLFDEYFSKVTFFANETGILSIDLDKINLDDDKNFYKDDPETITHVRLLTWHNKFEKRKALKNI